MISILLIGLGANKPSTRLRMLPLAEALRARGHRVTWMTAPSRLAAKLKLPGLAARHDVVLVQKKLFPTPLVALLRRANAHLIFDVDDAVMFHELERHEPLSGKFFARFTAMVSASQIVVTGNGYLAEFARAARRDAAGVTVLPTPIDTQALAAKISYAKQEALVIGWLGTKGNLSQLKPLAEPLRALLRDFPHAILRLVADATLEIPGVPVVAKAWKAAEEADDLRAFDIGIMPLEDNLWTRGKGGYKLLQYMAAGVPAIASPVGINCAIIHDGENGFLARDPATWTLRLRQLAEDAQLRERVGRAARATIEARFSLKDYLDRYVALIEDACR